MYNSRFVNREDREEDADFIAIAINKLIREGDFSAQPQPMSVWKCLICAYFSSAFHLGLDHKRYDEKYHRSIFDILYKDRKHFKKVSITTPFLYDWINLSTESSYSH